MSDDDKPHSIGLCSSVDCEDTVVRDGSTEVRCPDELHLELPIDMSGKGLQTRVVKSQTVVVSLMEATDAKSDSFVSVTLGVSGVAGLFAPLNADGAISMGQRLIEAGTELRKKTQAENN